MDVFKSFLSWVGRSDNQTFSCGEGKKGTCSRSRGRGGCACGRQRMSGMFRSSGAPGIVRRWGRYRRSGREWQSGFRLEKGRGKRYWGDAKTS